MTTRWIMACLLCFGFNTVVQGKDTASKNTNGLWKAYDARSTDDQYVIYKEFLWIEEAVSDSPGINKNAERQTILTKTRQAWKKSLILPGWGQYSNGGLWWIKVPVIYGGFVAAGLVFEFNHFHYQTYLKEVHYRLDNNDARLNPDYINRNTQYMIDGKDYHRRNRDLTVLITLGWYAIGAIEAYTDFMLKNRWNTDDELAFKISPTLLSTGGDLNAHACNSLAPGVKITFNFR